MKHATVVAIEGCRLLCPQCFRHIGTLRKTLYEHFTFGLDAISFSPGVGPVNGGATCPECGASYAELDITLRGQQMLIHTEHGWLPKPPPNVKPPKRGPIVTPR